MLKESNSGHRKSIPVTRNQFFSQETNSSQKKLLTLVKDRVHSEMKTFVRLDYCPHIQPITLIFPKSVPTFYGWVSVSKICTSGDLHRTIRGPASHHPRTCITPSVDLHHTIRGPAAEHMELHQAIRTCNILP